MRGGGRYLVLIWSHFIHLGYVRKVSMSKGSVLFKYLNFIKQPISEKLSQLTFIGGAMYMSAQEQSRMIVK